MDEAVIAQPLLTGRRAPALPSACWLVDAKLERSVDGCAHGAPAAVATNLEHDRPAHRERTLHGVGEHR